MIIQLQIGNLAAYQHREALIPYEQTTPIVIAYSTTSQTLATDTSEGFALQLLAQHPIGQAKVLLCEATPSRHFSQLKRLFAETQKHLGEQFFTAQDYQKHLLALNELAHRRFALFSSAHVDTISQYNAVAFRPEAFIYLIVTGIEAFGNENQTLQLLQNLCTQGAAVGITPILLYDEDALQDSDSYENKRKLFANFWQSLIPVAFGIDCRPQPIQPLNKLQSNALWQLLHRLQLVSGVALATRKQWTNTLIEQHQALIADDKNQDFLRIPIGMEGGQRAHFCLGEAANAYHVMIAGTNRSGKSTLLNNVLISVCETYSPDELRLWLFDYREGAEFHIFAGLAHLDALHINNADKPYAINAFSAFEQEMQRRTVLFRESGFGSRLVDYNQKASEPLPRLLMIIDEAQELFTDRESKTHAKRMLAAVTRRGASAGMHIILSTQTYQNVDLEADVKDQIRLRIALQLGSSMSCRALMGRDNDAPLNLPRFTAVYNNNFGEARDNRIIALDDLPDLTPRLAALKQRYPQSPRPVFGVTENPAATKKSADSTQKKPNDYDNLDDVFDDMI